MLKTGQILELHIEKLISGGEGLGYIDGLSVFVPDALPGDHLQVKLISLKSNYGRALIQAILSKSEQRVSAPCPVLEQCGGCQWQHYDYQSQLASKKQLLLESMQRIGKWESPHLADITQNVLGMQNPWHFRNKGQFPIQHVNGRLQAGFYAPRSHQLVPIDDCLIHHPMINQILQWLVPQLQKSGLQAYDELTQSGELRHVLIRHGFKTNQSLVGFVTRTAAVHAKLVSIADELQAVFPSIVGVLHNLNGQSGNRILGDQTQILAGQSYYLDQLDDLHFEVSLPSFFQVNPIQTEVLYQHALNFAQLEDNQEIIDAYCGAGTISLYLAKQGCQVKGIEVLPAATQDAYRNAQRNQISNIQFITGKVEAHLPHLIQESKGIPTLILDPPRKGCEPSVLDCISQAGVKRVVYVSCNPSTLARDSYILKQSGFQLQALQPVDMFPHSHHLETVALFSR